MAVVVVKDQFGNTMASTEYTLGYVASSSSVATVDTTGKVTAATYNSTLYTTTLTVTATPKVTGGVAKSGTATITVTQDTTKPTIVSASATNNKTIMVTYSKKVKDSTTLAGGALNPANYSLYNASTGSTTSLEAADGTSTTKVQATLIFSDTTQTVVKITINNVGYGTSISGFAMGGLTDANYRVYVSNVTDIAGTPNTILAGSNALFAGTTTPDASAPVLQKVEYNKGTGVLVLTFDKLMTNSLASYSKLKFNTTVLTGAPTVATQATDAKNKITMTLTDADKTAVAALTGDLTLTLLAAAVTDTGSTANAETSKAVTLTTPPALLNAAYDESTNTLTLGFDQTIDVTNSSILSSNKMQLKSNEMTQFALDATDTLLTTSNNATLSVLLSSTHANNIESKTTHTSPKVVVAAAAFKNIAGTSNLQQDDSVGYPAVAFTIAKDSTKPVVTKVEYSELTRKLVFTFNVPVSRTFVNASVKMYTDQNDSQTTGGAWQSSGNLVGLTATEVIDSSTLTFDLSATNAGLNLEKDLKTIQQGSTTASTPASYNSYFQLVAEAFTKSGSSTLKSDAVSAKATATTVVYTDNVGPFISTINTPDPVTVTVTFNEKVNQTDAENTANYKLYLMNGQTKTEPALTINSALMTDATGTTWGKKSVTLITATQTTGATYLLEIANVKDVTGNVISTTDATKYSKTVLGNAGGGSVPSPAVASATIIDSDNSDSLTIGDKVKVVFDRPVKISSTSTAVDANAVFTVTGGSAAVPASYDKNNITIDATDSKIAYLAITSAWSASPVQVGVTSIYLTGSQNHIVDKYSSTAAVTAVGNAKTITPPGDTAAITSATIEDINNNGVVDKGDKVVVTMNKSVKLASGLWAASQFTVKYDSDANNQPDAAVSFGSDALVTSTIDAATYGTVINIEVGQTGVTFNPSHLAKGAYIGFTAASTVVDKWNVGNAVYADATSTTHKKMEAKNTVAAPQVQSVVWHDVNSDGIAASPDYFLVTFNVPVALNAAVTAKGNWQLGATSATTMGYNASSVAAYDGTNTKLKMVLTAGGGEAETVADAKFDVIPAGAAIVAYALTNFNGNLPVVNGTGLAVTAAPADNTRPSVVSAVFIDVNKVKIVFDKAVDISAISAAKIGIEHDGTQNDGPPVDPFNTATDAKGSTVIMDTTDTTNKTIIVTMVKGTGAAIDFSSVFGSNVMQTGYTSALHTKGLGFLAGNGVKNPASGLEVTAFGASAASVDKKDVSADTFAPTAPTTAQLANFYYDNATGKVSILAGKTVAPSETAKLEVYIGTSTTPSIQTAASGVSLASFADNNSADTNAEHIKGIAAKTAGNYIFYRFRDLAGNTSTWVQNGVVPSKPNELVTAFDTNVKVVYDSSASAYKFRVVAGSAIVPTKTILQAKIAGLDLGNGAGAYANIYYNNGNTDVTVSSGSYLHGQVGGSTSNYVASFTAPANTSAITYRMVSILYGNASAELAGTAYATTANGDVANFGFTNVASNAAYVYNATAGALVFPAGSKLEFYRVATAGAAPTGDQTGRVTATFSADTTIAAGATVTGLTALTSATATDKVYYRFIDAAGVAGSWTQDGTVPAAPVISANAITANLGTLGNTVNHINKALKEAANNMKINAKNDATGNEAGNIFFKLADKQATPHTYTTATGTAIAAGAVAADTGTFAAGAFDTFTTGDGLDITGWVVNAAGNRSVDATTISLAAGAFDIVLPTATLPVATGGTNQAANLVATFGEQMYVNGTAIPDTNAVAPAAAYTTAGGTLAITSATYSTTGHTITFVLANTADTNTLTHNSNATALTDAAGNKYAAKVYTYAAAGTLWSSN